tara:strand:- start:301 stop:492 length:192 start_codon:yes stop_codon:yes gene_type:complete
MSNYVPNWRAEDEKRVKLMNIWYTEDGRHNKSHPSHGLFTGLAQKYKNRQNLEIDSVDELTHE